MWFGRTLLTEGTRQGYVCEKISKTNETWKHLQTQHTLTKQQQTKKQIKEKTNKSNTQHTQTNRQQTTNKILIFVLKYTTYAWFRGVWCFYPYYTMSIPMSGPSCIISSSKIYVNCLNILQICANNIKLWKQTKKQTTTVGNNRFFPKMCLANTRKDYPGAKTKKHKIIASNSATHRTYNTGQRQINPTHDKLEKEITLLILHTCNTSGSVTNYACFGVFAFDQQTKQTK